MKFLILGDCHIRASAPESRTDDFAETQLDKMQQAVEVALTRKCAAILQPGDLCDTPHIPKYLISKYIRMFRDMKAPMIYTVLGQHDIPMRSEESLNKTTDYLLESAGCIRIIKNGEFARVGLIRIDGCSYGSEPPNGPGDVLLIHAPIGDRPLYPGDEPISPKKFLKEHDYRLIVAGDYHYTFEASLGERRIVNAGCLVRKTASQYDKEHKPCVYIWDSESGDLQKIPIKVKPAEDVFVEKGDTPNKESSTYLSELLESLKTDRKIGADFFQNLERCLKKEKPPTGVVDKIRQAVAEVRGKREGV